MGTLVLVVETHVERRRLRLAQLARQRTSVWLGVLNELGMEGTETEFKPHECRHSAKQVTRSMWWRAAEVVIMTQSAGSAGDTSANVVPIGTESSAIGTQLSSTPGCAGIMGAPHTNPATLISGNAGSKNE